MDNRQTDNQNPREILKRRIEKDQFLTSFIWLLGTECLLAIGYPLVDLYDFLSIQQESSLRVLMLESLGYTFFGTIVLGTVVSVMAIYRLKKIPSKQENRSQKIFRFGLYSSIGLVILVGLAWLIVSFL